MSEQIYSLLSFELLVLSPLQGSIFGALTALSLGGMIYTRHRINTLKNEKAELRQLVNERSELLTYSVEREKKSRDNAQLANRSKSLLLARINHEIRTPLNGILGMVSLLNETTQTNEQREYCETIRDCGDNLLQVVNDIMFQDILSYSKIESGKMELEQNDFDFESSVEEVLDAFSAKAAERSVELIYRPAPDTSTQVVGDALRFRQILMNLVENALERTAHGEIMISVKSTATTTANTVNIEFEIEDSGSSIDAEKLKLISGDKDNITAANAGLSISRKLIQLMGGTFTIENLPSKGNKIKFTIQARTSLVPVRAVATQSQAELEGKKILVVETNAHLASTIKSLLEQWKLVPLVTHSGSQAIQILSQHDDVMLMLTDLQLGDLNGIDFTENVKQQYPQLPVILMAPAGDVNGKEHPDLFASVISKPLKRDALSKQILSTLLHKGSTGANRQAGQAKLTADFSVQHPMRILIAEDNLTNQKLAMKVLGKLGYKPDVAQHGKEVLEIVSHKNYDLILMDVQMPFMDGLEASRMIRLCLSTQPIIIAMTANTLQGDRDECMRAGMDDYISKPINLEELVTVLEKWSYQVNEKQ
jgi:signal transduction histidine kinase/CheY-like chemotaxis protein